MAQAGGGANHVNGAGGYSAGISEEISTTDDRSFYNANGKSSYTPKSISDDSNAYCVGGGYLEAGKKAPGLVEASSFAIAGSHIGGQGPNDYQYRGGEMFDLETTYGLAIANGNTAGKSAMMTCYVGSGGFAGKGGTVTVSRNARIYAYNGNECTLSKGESGYYSKPLTIYIQSGNPLDVYITNSNLFDIRYTALCEALGIEKNSSWQRATSTTTFQDYCITKSMRRISYSATSYGQGIGSGAGYVEISNGTYSIDTTGSMDTYINAVKDRAVEFSEILSGKGIDFKLGLIGFGEHYNSQFVNQTMTCVVFE